MTLSKRHLLAASLAALAVGAHGLIVEVHPNPDAALSDGPAEGTATGPADGRAGTVPT